jgi:hypothetical protein
VDQTQFVIDIQLVAAQPGRLRAVRVVWEEDEVGEQGVLLPGLGTVMLLGGGSDPGTGYRHTVLQDGTDRGWAQVGALGQGKLACRVEGGRAIAVPVAGKDAAGPVVRAG